ncbi:hypothetical protein [Anaerospora sp.]|uniref:hypothetical protein n=1 Tax=Anaerospora sp. TaxID=1960278 RepID=UPI0028A0EC59|nr:hypothetical protein [Anaerospora sp.]
MVVIEIPDEEVVEYLTCLKKVQQRHRYLECYLGKRIPVEHNSIINSMIKQLEESIMLSGIDLNYEEIARNLGLENNKKIM